MIYAASIKSYNINFKCTEILFEVQIITYYTRSVKICSIQID